MLIVSNSSPLIALSRIQIDELIKHGFRISRWLYQDILELAGEKQEV